MGEEKVIFIEVLHADGTRTPGRMFARFSAEGVQVTLMYGDHVWESKGYSMEYALLELSLQLPTGTSWKETHVVQAGSDVFRIEEVLSPYDEDQIGHVLRLNHNGKQYESRNYTGAFEYALEDLQKQMGVDFQICASCKYADFKSEGGEDLRHGWYCLRDVKDIQWHLPWWQREEEFEQAIPHVSAFHWCPRFVQEEAKKF